jgi:hypothetical protein
MVFQLIVLSPLTHESATYRTPDFFVTHAVIVLDGSAACAMPGPVAASATPLARRVTARRGQADFLR